MLSAIGNDAVDKLLAEVGGLLLSDAMHIEQPLDRRRPLAGHVAKRGVAKHDVSGHAPLDCFFAPQLAQRLEQSVVDAFPRVEGRASRWSANFFCRLGAAWEQFDPRASGDLRPSRARVEFAFFRKKSLADELLDPLPHVLSAEIPEDAPRAQLRRGRRPQFAALREPVRTSET